MASPGNKPRWATDPDNPLIDLVEPSEAQKDEGWNKLQKPPYNTFNWLQAQTYYWIDYLDTFTKFGRGTQVRSNHPFTFSAAGALAFTSDIEVIFRDEGVVKTNFIAAADSPKTIPAGSVLVFRPDFSIGSSQLIFQAVYANLAPGEYAIVAEGSLTWDNTDEVILLRHRTVSAGNDQYGIGFSTLEVVMTGQQYITDSESGVRSYFGGAKILDSIRILDGDNFTMYSDNGSTVKFIIDGATGITGLGTGSPVSPSGRNVFLDISAASFGVAAMAGLAFHNGSSFTTGANWEFLSGSPAPGITEFFLDGDSVPLMRWKANGDISIRSTAALFFDGVTGAGDTYMLEEAANQWALFVGGSVAIRVESIINRVVIGGTFDLAIGPTKKLQFDTGGVGSDTNISETSANVLTFTLGGVSSLRLTSTTCEVPTADLIIDTTFKFYLDTGADTYIWAPVGDQINFVTGGTNAAVITNSFFSIDARDFAIQSGRRAYWDGGIDTYAMWNDGAASLEWYINGNLRYEMDTAGTATFFILRSENGTVSTSLQCLESSLIGIVGTSTNHPFHIRSNVIDRLVFETGGRIVVQAAANLIVENDNVPDENGHVTSRSLAKAWLSVDNNGTGADTALVYNSYNVSSISGPSGGGAGFYTLNFDRDMDITSGYVFVGSAHFGVAGGGSSNERFVGFIDKLAGSVTFAGSDDGGSRNPNFDIDVAVFGDLQ